MAWAKSLLFLSLFPQLQAGMTTGLPQRTACEDSADSELDTSPREAGESKESDPGGGNHEHLGENPASAPDWLCDHEQVSLPL